MKKYPIYTIAFLTTLETGFMCFPKTLILLVDIACAISLYYTARNLGIKTGYHENIVSGCPF
jgi:hypothetical protein